VRRIPLMLSFGGSVILSQFAWPQNSTPAVALHPFGLGVSEHHTKSGKLRCRHFSWRRLRSPVESPSTDVASLLRANYETVGWANPIDAKLI